jgi:hypothetical protein
MPVIVNRFAGTRIEDLVGEIPSLCKDQHGCRYLQKKLEEGLAEHRDLIFRETFGHFADLMTGTPFSSCGIVTDEQQTDAMRQIPSATTFAKSFSNMRTTSSAISFASLLRPTWSIFP